MAGKKAGLLETARGYGITVGEEDFLEGRRAPANQWLQETLAFASRQASTWASRESVAAFLVAPVLLHVRRFQSRALTLWHGAPLGDGEGFDAVMDFCFTERVRWEMWPEGPCRVVAAVDTSADLEGSWGRCLAGLPAAQRYNGSVERIVYGCATDGRVWQFGRLSGLSLVRSPGEFTLEDLGGFCGAWREILAAAREELRASSEGCTLKFAALECRGRIERGMPNVQKKKAS
jgi:hypothetical protein